MHHNNAFVKKTKKGKVLKVVREHYLRDDIWSGSPLDPDCDPSAHKLSSTAGHYLVVDTNVALHQLDFLEHPAIKDVIVCSVVLEETGHKNASAHARLRALCASEAKRFFVFANEHHRETYIKAAAGESPNDRNDRAIRVAAKWYAERLAGKMKVLLVTNDAASRERGLAEGLEALSVRQYCRQYRAGESDLADLVAAGDGRMDAEDGHNHLTAGPTDVNGQGVAAPEAGPKGRAAKRRRVYADHLLAAELAAKVRAGTAHQGALRINRFNPYEGYVASEGVGRDILITGRLDMNRAMDGDIVVVELLPEAEWRQPSSRLPAPKAGGDAGEHRAPNGQDEEGEDEDVEGVEEVAGVFQVAAGEDFEGQGADSAAPTTMAVQQGGASGVSGAGSSTGGGGGEAVAGTDGKQPTGRVIGIVKRNWRSRGYCGSLQPPSGRGPLHGAAHVLFLPVERKYPAIRIQTRQAEQLMDKRLVVVIDAWPADSSHPQGHYVRTLGTIGDKDTETEVILIEHDINTSPFTPAVHDCVPPLPWAVTEDHLREAGRLDLRHLDVCSVDPPGCKDIDDALHVRPLPGGHYELGVHIADVTHFLRPGTAMDAEACTRATTTYLVQRRIDMLPKPLTEDICSLRGGQERLTFSVLWEVDEEAHILGTTFTKAVIRSRAAMTYQEAQERIDDPSQTDPLTESLRTMNRLAKILRARRVQRGALQLASPEVKFTIDTTTQDPLEVGMYQVRDTNQMVEEMMLLANVAVAERIAAAFPSCSLLRRHATPAPRQFDPVLRALGAVGLSLDVTSSKALAASLDSAVRPEDPYFNKLVRILTTRCMTPAQYIGSGDHAAAEYYHYGLASPIYTHFTSPIRRYADVVVHRLLAAVLALEPLPDNARDRQGLRDTAANLNARHRNAQWAGRASVELHTLIFFKDRIVTADARVTKVKANGLLVFVPKYGIEGPVYLTSKADEQGGKGGDMFILDEAKQTVRSKDGLVSYKVFDPCAVQLSVEEGVGHRRSLRLQLVPREQLPVAERV